MSWFSNRRVKTALAQMRVVQGERDTNLRLAEEWIRAAAAQDVELVVLPQVFATGMNLTDLHALAEGVPNGTVCSFLRDNARRHSIYLIAGVLEKDGRDIYDSVVLVSSAGDITAKYRRWFLWQMEKDFVSPGAPAETTETALGRIGLICAYDLNFPEACRGLFREQVDLIVCPTAVFDLISYPIRGLCRARAYENHCYFVVCGALGRHEFANARFASCSMIACDPLFTVYEDKDYDPTQPDVIAEAGEGEQLVIADLNLALMARRRHKVAQYLDLEFALRREAVAK